MKILAATRQVDGEKYTLRLSESYSFVDSLGNERTSNNYSLPTSIITSAVLDARVQLAKADRKRLAAMVDDDVCSVIEDAEVEVDDKGFITKIAIDLVGLGLNPIAASAE